MRQAGLECQAINQRLERRARRAQGGRHIERTETAGIEIAGRADLGDHLAGRVVDRDQRGR